MLRITARSIAKEFDSRGVKYEIVDKDKSILRYKNHAKWHYLRSSLCEFASPVGVSIADNKRVSRIVAQELGLNTPEECDANSTKDTRQFLKQHKRLVVKPIDAAHGDGVTTGVSSMSKAEVAIEIARGYSPSKTVILQEMVDGEDLRLLVIDKKVVAATKRVHASVTGDGVSTIEELINNENSQNDLRGENYMKSLNIIDIDAARRHLGKNMLTVVREGVSVPVVGTANIGTGGTCVDITDSIPKEAQQKAVDFSQHIGLPVCAVDFIASDITYEKSYKFIEVNSCPSFGLHLRPSVGNAQPVDILFVDYLMEQV